MANFLVSLTGQYINLENTTYQQKGGYSNAIDHITDDTTLIFDDNSGRLQSFRDFMPIYRIEDSSFYGYLPIQEFYKKKQIDRETGVFATDTFEDPDKDLRLYKFRLPQNDGTVQNVQLLSPFTHWDSPQEGDTIFLVSRMVIQENGKSIIRTIVASFDWPGRPLEKDETLRFLLIYGGEFESGSIVKNYKKEEKLKPFKNQKVSSYYDSVVNHHKYWTYQDLETRPLFIEETNIIESIAMIFEIMREHENYQRNIVDNSLDFIFDRHFDIINDITYSEIPKEVYRPTFTSEYFNKMRIRLLAFYYYAIRSGYLLDKASVLNYLVSFLDEVSLSHLSLEEKTGLIRFFVDGNHTSGRWLPFMPEAKLTHEETIIKLVRSVAKWDPQNNLLNEAEVNQFMAFLLAPYKIGSQPTLYETLYSVIDDNLLFGDKEKGARGQFVDAIYALWLHSDYNPNYKEIPEGQDPPIAYRYMNRSEGLNYAENLAFDAETSPAPFVLDYSVEKFGLWYFDNFEIHFVGNKLKFIAATNDISMGTVGIGAPVMNNNSTRTLYGYYDLFQPVTVVSMSNDDTIIRMPINLKDSSNITDDPCKNAALIDNSIPVFYLKYIDDKQDINNIKANLEVVAEVALTFSGVANLARLRHLRHMTLIGRTGLTTAQRLALSKAWSVFFGIVDLGTGISALAITLTDGCENLRPCEADKPNDPESEAYKRWQACRTAHNWLLGIGLLSAGAGLAVARWVRNISRKLSTYGEILKLSDDDILLLTRMGELEHIVAGFDDLLKNYTKLEKGITKAQLTSVEKTSFYEDFVRKNNALDTLESLTETEIDNLIKHWRLLRSFGFSDKATNITFLTNSKFIGHIERYQDNPILLRELNLMSNQQLVRYFDVFSDISPLPTQRFIAVWRKVDEHKTLGPIFRDNKAIVEELTELHDIQVDELLKEMSRRGKHMKDVRERIYNNPKEIHEYVQPLLDNPAYVYADKDNTNPVLRWWRRSYLGRIWMRTGKKFEDLCVEGVIDKSSDIFKQIREGVQGATNGKDIDDGYELHTQLQLYIGDTKNYFVADMIFIKYGKDTENFDIIEDIIIIENKLQATTNLSKNQELAFEHRTGMFQVRTQNDEILKSKYLGSKLENGQTLSLDGREITFIKMSDDQTGDIIKVIETIKEKKL